MAQIHASKNTYCSYVTPEDAQYDVIVPNLKKINASAVAQARKNKAKRLTQEAWQLAKDSGQKKIKLSDHTVSTRKIPKTDLVFRAMMFDSRTLTPQLLEKSRSIFFAESPNRPA